jgi:hypothetical protein
MHSYVDAHQAEMELLGELILKERVQSLHSYNREVEKEVTRGGTKPSVPCIHGSIPLSITSILMHYAAP